VAQAADCLLCKQKALSSNPSPTPPKKRKKNLRGQFKRQSLKSITPQGYGFMIKILKCYADVTDFKKVAYNSTYSIHNMNQWAWPMASKRKIGQKY
jgi:hypothetical protein